MLDTGRAAAVRQDPQRHRRLNPHITAAASRGLRGGRSRRTDPPGSAADPSPTSAAEALAIASALGEVVGTPLGQRMHPLAIARALGWEIRFTELAAKSGGQDALLIPTSRGFAAVIDPRLNQRERWAAEGSPAGEARREAAAAQEFRLAHELAHSVFYTPGPPPRRAGKPTDSEERLCDRVALEMLVPGAQTKNCRSASDVVQAARRLRAPLGVVATAVYLRSGHPLIGGEVDRSIGRVTIRFATGLDFDPTGWTIPVPPQAEAFERTGDDWAALLDPEYENCDKVSGSASRGGRVLLWARPSKPRPVLARA